MIMRIHRQSFKAQTFCKITFLVGGKSNLCGLAELQALVLPNTSLAGCCGSSHQPLRFTIACIPQ